MNTEAREALILMVVFFCFALVFSHVAQEAMQILFAPLNQALQSLPR